MEIQKDRGIENNLKINRFLCASKDYYLLNIDELLIITVYFI